MIGSLRGTVLERTSDASVLLEVGGVGYLVTVSNRVLAELEPGTAVFLYIHHHIREDAQTLYGFSERDERVCFEALLGAHGVGPAMALAILSVHQPTALAQILADEDVGALCLVPGVGKKTAARLLVELKSRLDIPDLDLTDPAMSPSADGGSARADVRAALAELGYGLEEIRDVLRDLPTDGDPALLLREALQRMAAAR